MRRALWVVLSLHVLACRSAPETKPSVDVEALEAGCVTRTDGGARLQRPDGVSLWFKDTGPREAPVVLFLHGGPGYNSYTFERSVGELLAPRVRVVYLDQRGSGRSRRVDGTDPAALGMQPTLADVEALREHLGIERWFVAGHSFGGVIAAEYARTAPSRLRGIIAIETSPDITAALLHQVNALARIGPERFPEQAEALVQNAQSDAGSADKVMTAYRVLGRLPLQAVLHFASPDAQVRMEQWDAASGLLDCGSGAVAQAYQREGYLGGRHPELERPLEVPGVLFGGRRSEVIGAENLERAAATWNVPLAWFEHSGHFIYLEEPQAFVDAMLTFIEAH